MADSAADAGAPNLNLTPEEKRVYGQLFRQADTENVGVVTGEIAVKFFEKTRLDSRILGEIWQVADKENRGFLTPAGFGVALRLIGHAQAGREPTPELALQPGPVPRFEGFIPAPPPAMSPTPTGTPSIGALQAQGTGSGPIRIPPLTPEKVGQYSGLFERQPLQNNLLPGEQAKEIFTKSSLPNDILGRIWQLADTEQRGALVQTEFVIAMHLLTSMKAGTLRALPQILPAGLYEAATRRVAAGPPRQQSPVAAVGPGLPAIPRQLSGQAQMKPGSPLGRSGPIVPQTTGDWLITPGDKLRFDHIYEDLDKGKKGFITGEEAVPFFSQSNLPEDTLAQIWDLADINSEGCLTRDEFAVAMYLIRQQRGQRGGAGALPPTLPSNLVPPSLRAQARPAALASSSPFDAPAPAPAAPQPPPPKPASALDDLFGLDASPPPTASALAAVPTGGPSASQDPFANSPASPLASGSPAKPSSPTTNSFKPFMPSSSFGRTLTQQATGDSTGSGFSRAAPPHPSASDDLLGDHDLEASKKINNESVELANLSNQIGSLSKQMQDVQGQRSKTQNDLNQQNSQKKNFEDRLSQLRALYEKEAGDVRALEEQLTNSRNETKKITMEMSTLDGTYQDLQNQHRTVLAALQADQQENASIKEHIRAVNAEIAQLKPQIEKLKSEARQQKGLVAINKKQLATNEGEREKLKAEAEELTKSNEEVARQINASSPASSSAQVVSPAPSTTSANNPFFRRTGSTDIMGAFTSPTSKSFNDKSFDDLFGPSPGPVIPPPATSFNKPQVAQHDTGNSTGTTGSFVTPANSTPTMSRQPTLATDPPAPPESRQISSSFLPMADPSESLSSSRHVSPPASSLGHVDPSTIEQPSHSAAAEPATTTAATTLGSDLDKEAEAKPAGNGDAIFGAASSTDTERPNTAAAPEASSSQAFSVADPAKAKEDFDSAFASFRSSHAVTSEKVTTDSSAVFSSFNTEFPPISELERDDESDSASERGGFDDDFAPASPQAGKRTERKAASPTLSKTITAEQPLASAGADPSTTSDNQTTAAAQPSSTAADLTAAVFGARPAEPDLEATPTATASHSTAATSSKGAFDDLDDEFEGLEDAKEGSADDDFATISRSGLDDFNPVFDSSPPPSHTNKSESNLTSTTNAFGGDSSFDFGSLSTTSHATPGGPGSSNVNSDNQNGTTPQASQGPAQPDSNDWDAIFASLDDPQDPRAAAASPPPPPAKETANNVARPPGPGRALTTSGEHDDPILKNLTGMGYSRTDALNALEKYDYNLERAANYLANQS